MLGTAYRKSRKIQEKATLGSGGVWGSIFIVSSLKRITRKLRRNILLHFGLITFRFHYWKALKPLIFMISDLVDVSMTPKTNIICLWKHLDTSNPQSFPYIMFL